MWNGFLAAKSPPVDNDSIQDLVSPIIKHINDVITEGNQEHTGWLLDYMANMIQHPHKKSQVAISLYGKQGCGKGILFDFFRNHILGTDCSFQTANPENDVLGRFSNGFVNRVFVQIDEVKSLHDFGDALKNIITNSTLNYEKKGKDTIVVQNMTNLLFTSNNENALSVPVDDRRFVLFRCSSVYKGDSAYFNALGSHLAKPEVARALYQHLLSRDLTKYPYDFQLSRPITSYYKETQLSSIPVVPRFFSALVNGDSLAPMSARELYGRYESYHKAGNYRFLQTETAFGRDVKRIVGINKKRSNQGWSYSFEKTEIKQYLVESNEYDADAIL